MPEDKNLHTKNSGTSETTDEPKFDNSLVRKRGAPEDRWHPLDWRHKFIKSYREQGIIKTACVVAGKNRTAVYVAREKDFEFKLAFAEADEEATDALEQQALARVYDLEKPADNILMFLLKARRPKKYRDSVDVKHSGNVMIEAKAQADTLAAYIKAVVMRLELTPEQQALLGPAMREEIHILSPPEPEYPALNDFKGQHAV